MKKIILLFFLSALNLLGGCTGYFYYAIFSDSYYHREKAEELLRQGKLNEAIEEYKKHIEAREKVKKKPSWENPYFYYLIIGDLYLEQNKWKTALDFYKKAENLGVDKKLVGDRIIRLGRWLEKHGQLEKAINLLEKHVKLDPDLFYIVLDRMGRALVLQKQKELLKLKKKYNKKR